MVSRLDEVLMAMLLGNLLAKLFEALLSSLYERCFAKQGVWEVFW